MKALAHRRLEQEIARIAALPNTTVGVAAQHIQTGEAIGLNSYTTFSMGSLYKLAIGAQLLNQVDQGLVALDAMINVTEHDISPGSGLIKDLLTPPGIVLSVRHLLELMLRVSDGTASDIVLRLAGGAPAVTDFLRSKGLAAMRVDRTVKRMLTDYYGVVGAPPENEWSLQQFREAFRTLSDEAKQSAHAAFLADPRDTATPEALCTFLSQLYHGEVISCEHRDLLITILHTSQTGQRRLKGLLPPGVAIAHKSGTLDERIVNDAGIITLPEGAGDVAVAVCVIATGRALSEKECVIAHIARAVYDYFLYY